jgi:protein farnesyltransferase/geranylgeranyltransferase type-1 subunit alpha
VCRALRLTADVIEQNSANYSAWSYRRSCLYALQSPLSDELKWTEDIAQSSPKNYQLWHHRRAIIEKMGTAGDELTFTVRHISTLPPSPLYPTDPSSRVSIAALLTE